MARCGCNAECNCVLVDGDCTSVAGNGNPASPYRVNVQIDPAADNQVSCGQNGLYVPPSSIEVADSDCIDMQGTGFPGNPVTATPIVSTDPSNLLECVPSPDPNSGLRARLFAGDTGCITVTGDGTAANPLLIGLEISPDSGNTLQCRPNGAYVPAVTQAPVNYRATLIHNGVCPTILPAAPFATTSSDFIDYDTVEEAVGLVPHLCGAGGSPYPNTCIEVPIGGGGIYLIQATHPGWSIPPPSTGDTILRLRLWRGTTAGGPADGIGQTAQVRYSTGVIAFNTPYLHVSRTIRLFDGDVVMVDFGVESYSGPFPGTILDTGPSYGTSSPPPFNGGLPFFQMTRIGLP
jgi:hypothetical protein